MNTYLIFLFTFLIVSCQSNSERTESQEHYRKGIEILQAADNNTRAVQKSALAYFKKAAQADPDHLEAKLWQSQAEVKLGMYQDAIRTTTSAIEKAENTNHRLLPNFYITAGIAESLKGYQKAANHHFKKAYNLYDLRIEQDDHNTDAIGNKAMVLCYMNRKTDALAFLDTLAKGQDAAMIEQIRADIAQFDKEEALQQLVLKE